MTVVKLNPNVSYNDALQNFDLPWDTLGLFAFLVKRNQPMTLETLIAETLDRAEDEASLHRMIDELVQAGYVTLE